MVRTALVEDDVVGRRAATQPGSSGRRTSGRAGAGWTRVRTRQTASARCCRRRDNWRRPRIVAFICSEDVVLSTWVEPVGLVVSWCIARRQGPDVVAFFLVVDDHLLGAWDHIRFDASSSGKLTFDAHSRWSIAEGGRLGRCEPFGGCRTRHFAAVRQDVDVSCCGVTSSIECWVGGFSRSPQAGHILAGIVKSKAKLTPRHPHMSTDTSAFRARR
jgi:hypothetical protein